MPYDPDRQHRQSTRWRGYDYASFGAYFVTICVHGKICLFGEDPTTVGRRTEMRLNAAGEMVWHWWRELANKWPQVEPCEMVVMPNHLHGTVVIHDAGGSPSPVTAQPNFLPTAGVATTNGRFVVAALAAPHRQSR